VQLLLLTEGLAAAQRLVAVAQAGESSERVETLRLR